MALFGITCPKCNRATMVAYNGKCVNQMNDGTICGFELPIKYLGGNSHYRRKFEKHTTQPPSGTIHDYSWVSHSGDYSSHQEFTLASGSLHLDTRRSYLFLFSTPNADQPLAKVLYGDVGTIAAATGVIMPLNSKPGNLHHFYGNYEPHFEEVAAGTGMVIESPNAAHNDFRVFDKPGGTMIYSYDPIANSGQRFVRPPVENSGQTDTLPGDSDEG